MDVDTWRILVVVREAAKLRLLGWHLASERALDVTLADRAGVGLELLRSAAFDLLISDVSAPGMDEYDVWEELGELAVRRGLPAMWLETDDPARSGRAGHATATSDFLPKAFTPQDLLGRVRVQLALLRTRHELQEERARLDQELDSHERTRLAMDCLSEELSSRPYPEHIAGISPATVRLRELVEAAARSDRPVLIVGETGTGKEMTARAIHNRSVRRERPFIKLNCAALAKDAMQEELCGDTQSGADTAGLKQLQGRLEFVQGGTLLLAELGELPLACQDKLARVLRLQDRERKRSGSPGRFDARVVATTSRDLLPLVKAGAFRADLFARLQDCPLTVPPLRDRRDDIPELLSHFAARAARRWGKQVPGISSDLRRQALTYHWPANLIELENCVDRTLMFARHATLDADPCLASPRSLAEVLRDHILRVLQKTTWEVEGPMGAARILGITPAALRRRMQKLGLARGAVTTPSYSDSSH